MNLPLELFTMLGSTILGGILKLWGMSQEAKIAEREMTLKMLDKERQGYREAREVTNKGFVFTRRVIALMVTFFVVAFPMLAAVYYPEVTTTIGYTEIDKGFWFFTNDVELTKWKEIKGGLSITPLHTHLMSSIIGMYFGGSLIKPK